MLVEETDPVPVLTAYPAPDARAGVLLKAVALGALGVALLATAIALTVGGAPAGAVLVVPAVFCALRVRAAVRDLPDADRPSLRVTAAGITRIDSATSASFVAWPDVVSLGDRAVMTGPTRVSGVPVEGTTMDVGSGFVIRLTGADAIVVIGDECRATQRYRRRRALVVPAPFMPGPASQLRARMTRYRPETRPEPDPADGSRHSTAPLPGPDDLATLSVRANLAEGMAVSSDPSRKIAAVAGFEGLLTDMVRVLGADHPMVLATCIKLAEVHSNAGDSARADADLRAVIRDAERALGRWDPVTLEARGRLASSHAKTGSARAAMAELTAVLADSVRVMDPDARQVLVVRADLAQATVSAGDPRAGTDAFAALLPDCVRVLGVDDDMTFGIRMLIEHLRQEAAATPR